MTERMPEGAASPAGGSEPPVPKDPPDQQVQEGEAPLDVPVPQRVKEHADGSATPGTTYRTRTGRERAERMQPGEAESEPPAPDEPTD